MKENFRVSLLEMPNTSNRSDVGKPFLTGKFYFMNTEGEFKEFFGEQIFIPTPKYFYTDTTTPLLEGEIWKSVIGFEGLYEASNLGRVKSLDHITKNSLGVKRKFKGRILKQKSRSNDGYLDACLYNNGKSSHKGVGTIIAPLFCENPLNKPEVNHLNSKPKDNRAINLNFLTRSEQLLWAFRHGNKTPTVHWTGKKGKDNPHSKPVVQLSKEWELLNTFEGLNDAEEKTGVLHQGISLACRGGNKKKKIQFCGGYRWLYLKDYQLLQNK
jgi:hypothetical protein